MSEMGSNGSSSPKEDGKDVEEQLNGKTFLSPSRIFDEVLPGEQLEIEFENISAYVAPEFGPNAPRRPLNPFRRSPLAKLKRILHAVSGRVSPGNVVAVMGPSGSGKSTLLELLGGRASRAIRCKGSILFNGDKMNKSTKRKMAFVSQDDLLHQCLTVYETLFFVAMLRLPKSWTVEDKLERVERVIEVLQLGKARDTIIGNGTTQRGVSGGERKRCSVGNELLVNPSLLMLDEPTSGLDSTVALKLIQILRDLASDGRSIITSIHQPSSRLFYLFDTLLLLSEGCQQYYGSVSDCHLYFETLGFSVPAGISTSDFILDLASSQVGDETRSGEEVTRFLVNTSEAYLRLTSHEGFRASDLGALLEAAKGDNLGSNLRNSRSASSFRRYSSMVIRDVPSDDRISWVHQVLILCRRSVKTRRHDVVTFQDFAQFIVIALLAGCFWWQIGKTNTVVSASEISGLLYFLMMFTCFRIMFTSLLIFPTEQKHLIKERKSAMYSLSSFYVARSVSDLPVDLSLPSLLLVIVYWMAGLNPGAWAFLGSWATLLLTMLVSQSIGLLIGALVTSVKTAQALAATLMLTFILVGGYFVQSIPVWASWVRWLSFLYYAFPLLLHLQFRDADVMYACYETIDGRSCQAVDISGDPQGSELCEPVQDLSAELRLDVDVTSTTAAVVNGVVLLGMLVLVRALVYLALVHKTRM